MRTRAAPARFLRHARVSGDAGTGGYPFTIPAVAWLARGPGLSLPPGVTFLVGENGTGKSTVVEALAVAAGVNPEGGSQNFRFATRASESSLGDRLVLTWGPVKPRTRFFLRAESYYNVASEIERLDREGGPPLLPAYGGEDGTVEQVGYDDALPVRLTREFLAAPERLLRHLHDEP